MATGFFQELSAIAPVEIAPGFISRLVHTQGATVNVIEVGAGNAVPLHRHPHEQISLVLEGQFEMTVDGQVRLLEPGMICVIPSNTEHGGRAIADCRLLDIFHPVREDYKALGGWVAPGPDLPPAP
jgi:quercetin dioxygenase-like cupin family protein